MDAAQGESVCGFHGRIAFVHFRPLTGALRVTYYPSPSMSSIGAHPTRDAGRGGDSHAASSRTAFVLPPVRGLGHRAKQPSLRLHWADACTQHLSIDFERVRELN